MWTPVIGRAKAYAIKVESGVISDLELSHDGKLMAVATDAGPIYVFDTATGTKIAELTGHSDGAARLWDIERGVAIDILTKPDREFSGMALDASQNRLALSRHDGETRLKFQLFALVTD
jgi:WD40 repeat protein